MPGLPVPNLHLGRQAAVTSREDSAAWKEHCSGCAQCQAYVRGDLDHSTLGQPFPRSIEACEEGGRLWAAWVNALDREYKNRT